MTCSKCGVDKADDEFYRNPSSPSGRRTQCKTCCREYTKARYSKEATTEYSRSRAGRNAYLKYNYGITVDQYEARLAAQRGGCAICSRACSSGKRLSVDHDHVTGVVRGLICMKCNLAVGHIEAVKPNLYDVLSYLGAALEGGSVMNQVSQQALEAASTNKKDEEYRKTAHENMAYLIDEWKKRYPRLTYLDIGKSAAPYEEVNHDRIRDGAYVSVTVFVPRSILPSEYLEPSYKKEV